MKKMVENSKTARKRFENGSETARKRQVNVGHFLAVLLMLLTIGIGNAWADAITTADMTLGTPLISEDFEDLSTYETKPSTGSSSTTLSRQTAFGVFTDIFVGKSDKAGIGIYSASSPFESKFLKPFGDSGKPANMYFNNTSIATKGAFELKFSKASNGDFGLYSIAETASEYAKGNTVVFLKWTGSALQISDGNTSTHTWQSVASPTSDLIHVLVVYNISGSADTYGDDISIGSGKAHVYINGTAVMNGDAPKAFTIPTGRNPYYFRVYTSTSAGMSIDDLNIYDELPTESCANKITWSDPTKTGTGTLTFDKSSGLKTCDGGNTLQATVTPGKGYKCTALSFTVSSGTVDIDPEIVAAELPVYPSSAQYDLTFAEDQSATLSASVTFTAFIDQFKDVMHGNSISNKSGNYGGMPAALSDETPGDDYCSEKHYKFSGWVVESDIDLETGMLKDGATIVPAGETGHYATGVTWYAVWAKENEVE